MDEVFVYLQFDDGTFGLIRQPLEDAGRIYARYATRAIREKEHVKSCWVVDAVNGELLLGQVPAEWTPKSPVKKIRD
jgi:hypothetical protein